MDADLSDANTDAWTTGLRRALATYLGIATWRVLIDWVRAGSVQVRVRFIDAEGMGAEPSAADSAARLEKAAASDGLQVGEYRVVRVGVIQPPSPPPTTPPPPLRPPPASPPPPLAPDPCEATDAASFVNASLPCTPQSGLFTWRLTVLALIGGGVVVAVVLVLGWFTGLSKDERKSAKDPFGKQEQRRLEGKKLTTVKKLKQKVCHPILGYWRSTMAGLLDLLTDLVFCMSLYHEGGVASPLFIVSVACIVVSIGFAFSATLWLYCREVGGRRSSKPIFSIEESSHRKIFFFLVMVISGAANVRLAALLPWRTQDRRDVLVRIQRLYLASKCIEDLPQLVIAAVYLSARGVSGDLSGATVNTAVLQLAVSGVSFLLTMVFLGLQVADSARKGALSSRSVFAGLKHAVSSRTGSRRSLGMASPSASVVGPLPVKPVDISVEVSHPSAETAKPPGESDADAMPVPSAPDEMSTTVRRSSAYV